MRTTTRRSLLPLLLLSVATGCVRTTTKNYEAVTTQPAADPTPEAVAVRELAVANGGSNDEAINPVAPGANASLRPPMRQEPALFRLGAGYGALGHIDLVPCREQGLQAGYLHVRVTFGKNGRVVLATVESHVIPPPEALGCIGDQLELAMVPVFEGGDVTLTKSFFVN